MSSGMLNHGLPVACGLVAADGRLIDCNDIFAVALGLDRQTTTTLPWDEGAWNAAVQTALALGQAELELPVVAPGGVGTRAFIISLHAVPSLLDVRRVLVVMEPSVPAPVAGQSSVLRQALAAALAEQMALRERNRHLEAVLESTPDLTFIHDRAGHLGDVSERSHFEEEPEWRASYDALTGLPNRTLLFDRLDQAIVRARRSDELFAFLFLDLDGFKTVNDQGGHEAGDQVLRIVAERFRAVLRASDSLARLGGDEFAVIAPELMFGDDVEPVAQKLCEALKTPIGFAGREYVVGVSIGIALFPAAAEDANGLYRAADAAMYVAKQEGRGRYRFAPPAAASASRPA